MSVSIKALAVAEKRMENERHSAENRWRAAWWRTTMALGKLPLNRRSEGIRVVMDTTGQSRSWVGDRAKVGAWIDPSITQQVISHLPPKLTSETVKAQMPIDMEMVQRLREAEADGISIREWKQQLTGKAWADTPEGASMETITKMVTANPRAAAEAMAANPAVNREYERIMLARHNRVHSGELESHPHEFQPSNGLFELTSAVMRVRRSSEGRELSDEARRTIEWAIAELTAIREGQDFVGDIEAWLQTTTT